MHDDYDSLSGSGTCHILTLKIYTCICSILCLEMTNQYLANVDNRYSTSPDFYRYRQPIFQKCNLTLAVSPTCYSKSIMYVHTSISNGLLSTAIRGLFTC